MKKRILSILLCAIMTLSLLPPGALAAETPASPKAEIPAENPVEIPAEKVCNCGAAADESGKIAHLVTCPLYAPTAPQAPNPGASRVTITEITTEQALRTAFSNGGNYKLGVNITVGDKPLKLAAKKTLTLDLNGFAITTGTSDSAKGVTTIEVEGNLTIKDTGTKTQKGSITGGKGKDGSVAAYTNGSPGGSAISVAGKNAKLTIDDAVTIAGGEGGKGAYNGNAVDAGKGGDGGYAIYVADTAASATVAISNGAIEGGKGGAGGNGADGGSGFDGGNGGKGGKGGDAVHNANAAANSKLIISGGIFTAGKGGAGGKGGAAGTGSNPGTAGTPGADGKQVVCTAAQFAAQSGLNISAYELNGTPITTYPVTYHTNSTTVHQTWNVGTGGTAPNLGTTPGTAKPDPGTVFSCVGWANAENGDVPATFSPITAATSFYAVWKHRHNGIDFNKPLPATGGALTAGDYYLDKDVPLQSTITINNGETVNLCLNGHKLTGATTGGAVIEVKGELNLYDCKSTTTTNTITNPNDNKSVIINGGVITGGTGKVGNNTTGGGVYVGGSGNFTMHGGTIAGNSVDTANSAGGGVYVVGSFTMNGGAISHNKSGYNGGGLCVGGAGQSSTTAVGDATLNGGTISNNAAGENGGAIRVTSSEDSNKERATLILSGTTIKDNSANVGAGIHTAGKVILDSDCGAQDIFLAGDLPVEVKKDATISATINLDAAGKTPGDLVTGVTTEAQANLFKVTGYAAGYTAKYDATTKSIKLVTKLTNTAINKTITYPGATYDVSQLFEFGTGAGAATYKVVSGGTGAGTGSLLGSTLTITTLGTFQIEMTTAATTTHEAGAPVTATLTVNKGAAPAAPTGVTATPTSVKGKADGTLTGVSSLMEYKLSTATGNYTAITETTVTGLAAGTYSVRVKETDLYLAGADASVTVTEGAALTVTFDSKGGSAVTAISDISYNTAISAPAAPTLANYIFDGWFTTDGGSTRWDFTNGKVTASITLYAKWTEKTAVSITETAQTKTYTGSALAFDITGSNATGNFEIVYKQGTTAVASPTNAGSYDVTITRPEDTTYAACSKTIANGLVIKRAPLTVTANAHTITYGDAPIDRGVGYSGFVGGQTKETSDIQGTLAYEFTYAQFGDISGSYTITPKGLTSDNYAITFTPGKLTVLAKEVTLTRTDPGSLVYTGTALSPTVTASGTVSSDTLIVTFSCTSGDGINVGDHVFTATALTGAKATNYKLPATVTYTMTITKATIAGVTADGYTGIYDGKPHDAVTVSGAPTGSTISYCETQDGTYTSANKTVQSAISEGQFWYKVTNPNYGEFTGSVMVNISALQLTTSVAATVTTEKIYDGNQSATVLTPGTLENNHDGGNVSLAATAGYDSKSVGENKTITITYSISGTSASNYIKPADATLSTGKITTTPLSVTGMTATSRDYNGTTTVAIVGGALSGKVESDTVTLGGTATGSVQTADKGNNKAVTVTGYTISGGDAGNYTLTQPTGVTVNITPRDMSSVAIAAIPKQDFTGAEVKPIVVVNDGGSLVLDKDYTVSYSGNTNLGTNTATVTVTGKGNYNSATSKDVKFTIGYANLVPNSYTLPTGFVPTTWCKDPITVTAATGYTVSKTATGSYGTSITFDTAGEQDVTFYIKNTAGGIAEKTISYKLDNTAPTVSLSPDIDSSTVYVDVEITVTAADEGGSGVKTVTVSGGHFTTQDISSSKKFTAAESTAGTYTYTVTVTDNAGNSASASVTIKLDPKGGQKPVDPVSPPAPNTEIPKTDGGSVTISPENPKPGDKVIITAKPDEGKALDKITVTDKDGKKIPVTKNPDGSFRFVQPEGKVTISVSFKTSTGLPWNPFTDVKIEDWFFDSVKYVYENGLMMGTDGTSFEPDLGTSRAMIVTILWRMQGEPKAKAASDFADVPAGAWYSEAIAWAQEQKLAAGVDEKHFEPNRNISRQELASLFYRYAVLAKLAPTGAWQVPLTYADKSKIADWAVEGAMFAQLKGFIKGRPGNIFAPNAPATRAEASSMLQRFITAK